MQVIFQVVLTVGIALFLAKAILSLHPERYFALIALLGVAGFLIKYPEIGLVPYSMALGFIVPFVSMFGLPEGLMALPLAMLIISSFLLFLFIYKKGRIQLSSVQLFSFILGILLFAGVFWTSAPIYGKWKAEAFVMYNLLITFCLTLLVNEDDRLRRIINFTAILGVLFLIIGAYHVFSVGITNVNRMEIKFGETLIFNPIWFGRSVSVSLVSFLILMAVCKSRIRRIALAVLSLCSLFLLFLTASRGPTLALFISLFLYYILIAKNKHARRIAILLVAITAIVCIFMITPEISKRRYTRIIKLNTETVVDQNISARIELYKMAWEIFLENPVIGAGTGGYSNYYGGVDGRFYSHNSILEIASELGLIGLFCFAIFILLNLKIVKKVTRETRGITKDNYVLIWGVLVFLIGIINSMFSGDLPQNKMLWFGSGFMWSAYLTYSAQKIK